MRSKRNSMAVWIFNLLAAAMALYAVGLALTSNFNMGNLMVWLLAGAMCGYAVWRVPLTRWFSTGLGRAVWWLLVLCLSIYALLVGFVAVTGHTSTATGQEKAIIVLGAGLRRDTPSNILRCRLDKAYDYAVQHPRALIVTSGGQGRDEWVPEGQAMRDYLIAKGLPPERIVAENRSTSTEENFAFSREILEERGIGADAAILYVSNSFHCYRAGKYARMAGFTEAHALPAATPLRSVIPCYLREALAVLYYWVFKSSQTGLMHHFVGVLSLNKKFFYK